VVDEARLGLAPADGHVERIHHELGAQVVGHLPADHSARKASRFIASESG
jgi:hypothetical protein